MELNEMYEKFDAPRAFIHGTKISLDDAVATVLANRERL